MPLEPHQARPCWTARPAPSCRAAHQQARRARAAGAREARRRRGGRGGRRRLGAVAGLARVLERLVLRKVLVEAVVQLRARAGGVTSAQGNRALRRWRTRATAWHGRMPPPCSRSPQGASAPANALSRTRPGQTSLALDVRGRTAGAQHRNSTRLTGAAIAMRVGHARATHVLADLAGAVHPRDAEPGGRPGSWGSGTSAPSTPCGSELSSCKQHGRSACSWERPRERGSEAESGRARSCSWSRWRC